MLVCSIGMYAQRMEGLALYLVGDATPIGWEGDENMRQPCRMQEILPGIYFWSGLLRHGNEGFKICKGNTWNGYHPSSPSLEISGNGYSYYTEDDANDWKWNPTNTDWQFYEIVFQTEVSTLDWYLKPEDFNSLQPVDGVISVGSDYDLQLLATMLRNNVNGESYNVKLTADIHYNNYNEGYLYGLGLTEKMPFKGEFDGQGHTITVNLDSYSTRFGLFGTVEGKVHDLKVAGKITATNRNQTGGICGLLKGDGSKIYNCISEVEIVDAQSGDGTIGGICAVTYNAASIENCAFYGKINAPNRTSNGGILGWANNGSSSAIKNCLVVADINWADGVNFGRNNPFIINSYKTTASDETLANGQMTYKLNNYVSGGTDWYQTLGTDAKPTPLYTSEKVYANGTLCCDGVTPKEGVITLGNTNESAVDPHVFGEDGICTVCHAAGQEPTLMDGIYQIANKGNMLWWAAFVNAGNPESCAVVTADLDMSDVVYVPAGTADNKYAGTFDGQGHAITLKLERSDLNYQGLFGVATDGATIKNVIVKGSVKGNSYVAGIVGGSNGGTDGKTLNILNCGNEAAVTAANANGAGIIGVNMSSAAHFLIKDCYNVGNITSGYESGAITGWTGGDKTTIENTYNIGTVTNGEGDGFIRGGGNLVNTYNLSASDAMVTSGELCAKLGNAFRQNIGEDAYPIFDKTHGIVKEITEAGYATMYVPDAVDIPFGVSAFTGEYEETWLKLNPLTDDVPAAEPVVLKGSAGYYSFVPATGESKKKEVSLYDNYSSGQDLTDVTLTRNNVKVEYHKTRTNAQSPIFDGECVCLYPDNRIDITAGGRKIKRIKFAFSDNYTHAPRSGNYDFIGGGSYDYGTAEWRGSSNAVILINKSNSNGFRIYAITVSYEGYPSNVEGNVLKGTAEDIEAAGKYILAKPDGEPVGFYLAETGIIKAGKAYLESDTGARVFFFEDEDNATSIKEELRMKDEEFEGAAMFNLAGQRLSKMQKGINIVNGKKILK